MSFTTFLETGWDWGTGFYVGNIREGERLRDRNFLAAYGVWDYLKNKQPNRERYRRNSMNWREMYIRKTAMKR